jgi:DNA-binding transcriptional LysR family regulator
MVQEGFDVTIRKIVPARRILCASPAYLKRRGMPRHPKDLRDHECLTYGHLATGTQWKLTGKDGDHWLQVPWTLCTNNAEVLRDAGSMPNARLGTKKTRVLTWCRNRWPKTPPSTGRRCGP